MSTILMTAILFAFAGCAALLMRKRFEEQLPLAAGLMILMLYGFAAFGQLVVGAYAVLGTAAAAMAASAWLLVSRRREKNWQLILTPGCAAFALCALWLLISYRTYMFAEWDDFSHWGLAVKNMDIFRAIPSGVKEATVTYRDYPPASTLFAWLWTFLSGAFNEGDCQRAMNMLMLCFMLPAMKDQRWKRPGKALCMSTALFVLPLLFAPACYRSMQVDVLLGLMVFYVLYAHFFSESGKGAAGIACALALLPLVKEIGLLFGVIVLGVIGADLLLGQKNARKTALKQIAVFALALALGKLVWTAYLNAYQVPPVWSANSITLEGVRKLLSGTGQVYQYDTLRAFAKGLVDAERWFPGNIIKVNFIMWMVAFVVLQSYLADRCSEAAEKKRFSRAFRLLMGGLLMYIFMLLVMYLFMFRDDEARKMISLDRYLSTYFIPVAGFTMMTLIRKAPEKEGHLSRPLCVLACMLLAYNPLDLMYETILCCDQNQEAYEMRMQNLVPEHVMARLDSQSDLVYVVSSGDNGYDYYMDAYQLTPVPIQQGMWTTWPVAEKIHIWTDTPSIQYSPEEWAALLKDGGFTYVYLDTVDERFINDYASLFETAHAIQDGEIYHVELCENGVKLILAQ